MEADFVPEAVARERMRRLTALVERHALTRHEARVGRIEEVVVEGPSKKDPTVAAGRTRQNKLVHFAGELAPGTTARVEITRGAPHWLAGTLLDVVDGPRTARHAHPGHGGLSRGHPSRARRSHRVRQVGARDDRGRAAR